jgi:hypothetical protein
VQWAGASEWVGGRRGGRWSWGHGYQCPLPTSGGGRWSVTTCVLAEHSETLAGSPGRAMACPLHATPVPVTLAGSASGWHVRVNERALKIRSSNLRPLARGLWVPQVRLQKLTGTFKSWWQRALDYLLQGSAALSRYRATLPSRGTREKPQIVRGIRVQLSSVFCRRTARCSLPCRPRRRPAAFAD